MDNEEMDYNDEEMLRKKAEEKLKKQQAKKSNTEAEQDVNKLLHELQVHQIELEMQNEELRNAYETAEAALKKYTMLYDFAPLGYFILDSEGNIIDLNFTGAEILGEKRVSLLSSNLKLFVSDDSKPAFINFLSSVYMASTKKSCQVELAYDGKHLCDVYMEGVVTGDEQQCLLSVVDISKFTT